MKSKSFLEIKTPCSEDFDKFSSTEKGGFCTSCCKEVIDFTKLPAAKIADYFSGPQDDYVCGRFTVNQLKEYNTPTVKKKTLFGYLSGVAVACMTLFSSSALQAQDVNVQKNTTPDDLESQQTTGQNSITVKGNVNEAGLPLPGVSVVKQGTTIGTSTDMDGNFVFPKKLKKGDILVFSFIGMQDKRVTVEKSTSGLKVEMQVDMESCGLMMMGKVAKKGVYSSKE